MLEKFVHIAIKNTDEYIHWHDMIELVLVVRGTVAITLNNREYILKQDDLLVLNCDDAHNIKLLSENSLYISFQINIYEFDKYIPNISNVLFKCSPDIYQNMIEDYSISIRLHMSKTIIDLLNNEKGYEDRVIFNIISILNMLRNTFNMIGKNPEDYRSLEQFERVWEAVEYMYQNYNRKLTLKELANYVHVSEDYLSHVFKNSVGRYFEEFLNFVRAEQAVRYLITTDLSMTNISYECGFSAPRYFNSCFKKIYGCLPSEYRANNKKQVNQVKADMKESRAFQTNIPKEEYYEILCKYLLYDNIMNGASHDRIEISFPELIKKANLKRFAGANLKCLINDTQEPAENVAQRVQLKFPSKHFLYDTSFIGPFLAKLLLEYEDDAVSFVKEHCRLSDSDFNGNFALFTSNGIKKPAYHAINLLSSVGSEILELSRHYFICRQHETVNIVLFNYPKSIANLSLNGISAESYPGESNLLSDSEIKFDLNITELDGEGIYLVTRIKLSNDNGNILDLVKHQSDIQYAGEEELNYMKNCCEPKITFEVINNTGTFQSTEYLEPNSLQIIRFRVKS